MNKLALQFALFSALIPGAALSAVILAQSRPPTGARAPENVRSAALDDSADSFFTPIYRNFYKSYKLGPGDELAVRVAFQPDYTLERVKVSPVGRIYHPLLGDVEVAGMTVEQLTIVLTREMSEYLLEPKVSVELVEAASAKIGVLGEVKAPGIIILARPMTVLDAIAAVGGVTDYGSKSNVTLLRPAGGRLIETKVNIKRLLEGKASLAENPTLRAGDTLIVHGNTRKKFAGISALIGFGQFVSFVSRGRY
jgi:polysaccharide export outer membrane protein